MSGRVIICGGRDWTDAEFIYRTLDRMRRHVLIETVIEGDGRGVDRIAGYWARRNGLTNLKFRAEWGKFGKAAGPIRNQRMIDEGKPGRVIAFPGGRGTADMVARARECGLDVIEVKDARGAGAPCPAPFPEDDGSVKDCIAKGHCGCDESREAPSEPKDASVKVENHEV